MPLYIDQTGGISIAQLAARARRLKRQKGLGLIVVDYLQLLAGIKPRAPKDRVQEVSEITTGLKALAKELNVPIIALSQLSRQVEQRDDKRPQLSDLRESGSIEQDADVVMFVFREEYYLERQKPRRDRRDAQVAAGDGRRSMAAPRSSSASSAMGRRARSGFRSRPSSRASAISPATTRSPSARVSGRDSPPEAAAGATAAARPIAARRRDRSTSRSRRELASAGRACRAGRMRRVVKADAYGLGAERVIPALAAAGCRTFFIATADEARPARRLAPARRSSCSTACCRARAKRSWPRRTPGALLLDEIREWAALAAARRAACRGASCRHRPQPARAPRARGRGACADSALLDALDVRLVMSHLACADDPADAKNEAQLSAFERLRRQLPEPQASLAASDGPVPRAALSLRSRAPGLRPLRRPGVSRRRRRRSSLQSRSRPRDPACARGRRRRDGRLFGHLAREPAVAHRGRGGGLCRRRPARSLSNRRALRGRVGVGATTAPIVGRVSMDLITVDVTDVGRAAAARRFRRPDRPRPHHRGHGRGRRHHRLRGADPPRPPLPPRIGRTSAPPPRIRGEDQ